MLIYFYSSRLQPPITMLSGVDFAPHPILVSFGLPIKDAKHL